MKRLFRFACIFLAVTLFVSMPVFATEKATPKASNFFGASAVYLERISYTTFEAWFDVKAVRAMDELGASVVKIQRSEDGVNWETMRTYTMEAYPKLICEDTSAHAACISYTGTPGYYYRAYIELYAKNSSGTGLLFRYTETMLL